MIVKYIILFISCITKLSNILYVYYQLTIPFGHQMPHSEVSKGIPMVVSRTSTINHVCLILDHIFFHFFGEHAYDRLNFPFNFNRYLFGVKSLTRGALAAL